MTTILVAFLQQFWLAVWALGLLIYLLADSDTEVQEALLMIGLSLFGFILYIQDHDRLQTRTTPFGEFTSRDIKIAVTVILILDLINQVKLMTDVVNVFFSTYIYSYDIGFSPVKD